MHISPIDPVAGAEVTGVDLRQPLDDETHTAILEALLTHHLLAFRGQDLSDAEQLAFTERFGEPENHVIRYPDGKPPPLVQVVSNLDPEGQPTSRPYSTGNYFWHTDKSYHAAPSFATILHARQLPPAGGDTRFANMHLAYEGLPLSKQAEIANLRAVHSWEASRRNTGNRPASEDEKRERPPVDHPIVRTHPDTGRKGLYIGIDTSHVLGRPEPDGKALLDELLALATQDAFVYAHQWRPGDLVMWDNRSLLHCATANYEMDRWPRVMHRTVVRGSVPV